MCLVSGLGKNAAALEIHVGCVACTGARRRCKRMSKQNSMRYNTFQRNSSVVWYWIKIQLINGSRSVWTTKRAVVLSRCSVIVSFVLLVHGRVHMVRRISPRKLLSFYGPFLLFVSKNDIIQFDVRGINERKKEKLISWTLTPRWNNRNCKCRNSQNINKQLQIRIWHCGPVWTEALHVCIEWGGESRTIQP